MKIKTEIFKRRRGSSLMIVALILCLITTGFAVQLLKLATNLWGTTMADKINAQAYEYARTREEWILAGNAPGSTLPLTALGNAHYKERVVVAGSATDRQYTIEVFYDNETTPRATRIIQPGTQVSKNECPIGTVIAWPSHTPPSEGGVWLLCDGQRIPAKYTDVLSLDTFRNDPYTPRLCGNGNGGHFVRTYGNWSGDMLSQKKDMGIKPWGRFPVFVFQYIGNQGSAGDPSRYGIFQYFNAPSQGRFTPAVYFERLTDIKSQQLSQRPWDHSFYRVTMCIDNSNCGFNIALENRPINMAVAYYIRVK